MLYTKKKVIINKANVLLSQT